MMSGHTELHEQLESQLADFVNKESAYLLNFGYQGILSTIDTLVGKDDVIVYDVDAHACIVDGEATIVKEDRVVLYVWYDNEFGYSCQVIRVVQKMAGIKYPLIPEDAEEMGF